jgi:hypothetical protein
MPYTGERATLFASATRATAIANSGGSAVSIGHDRTVVMLDVTATAGVAGDTLDVFVDVLAPDGVTWLNAVHFTQVAGNSAAIKHYAVLAPYAPAATTFDVTADCAAGVTKPYLWGQAIRGRYTLVDAGAHGQSVTFSLSAISG